MQWLFLLFWLCYATFNFASEGKTGTLIVSYQTGPMAERLERIRFHLIESDCSVRCFPRRNDYVDDIAHHTRRVVIENLQPGIYSLAFRIPNHDNLFEEIQKREIQILPGKVIKIDQAIHPRYASLKVSSALIPQNKTSSPLPTITLRDSIGKIHLQSTTGHLADRHLIPGQYTLIFETVPGYQSPPSLQLALGPHEMLGPVTGTYIQENQDVNSIAEQSIQKLSSAEIHKAVLVPEGKLILGDPLTKEGENELPPRLVKVGSFYMGTYEVTNEQFTQWLNTALLKDKITFHSSGEMKGLVTNKQEKILCKTAEANSLSQIDVKRENGRIHFLPLRGYDLFPVIFVSWEGAKAYCQDNQCRLPTEAEWEKAAGMAISSSGTSLKKYRFGFSRDEIDPSWANYKC
jgi:formylglycine-generating enzyme required for sulfatase activity